MLYSYTFLEPPHNVSPVKTNDTHMIYFLINMTIFTQQVQLHFEIPHQFYFHTTSKKCDILVIYLMMESWLF